MIYLWLFIIIALTLIELATVSLTTIWFIISGLVALICSIFIKNFIVQFAIFVILGLVLLITTRKYLIKFINVKNEKTNFDRIISMTGIVTKEIKKNYPGEVKVDGKYWTAVSDKKISINSTVKVLLIDGVKIKVEEVS